MTQSSKILLLQRTTEFGAAAFALMHVNPPLGISTRKGSRKYPNSGEQLSVGWTEAGTEGQSNHRCEAAEAQFALT